MNAFLIPNSWWQIDISITSHQLANDGMWSCTYIHQNFVTYNITYVSNFTVDAIYSSTHWIYSRSFKGHLFLGFMFVRFKQHDLFIHLFYHKFRVSALIDFWLPCSSPCLSWIGKWIFQKCNGTKFFICVMLILFLLTFNLWKWYRVMQEFAKQSEMMEMKQEVWVFVNK